MPVRPLRPCAEPHCPSLIASGVMCEMHEGTGQGVPASSTPRGVYGRKWRLASRAYLRSHPRCVECDLPADTVDHKVPHRNDPALFWDRDNWQSLCASCHSRKTAQRDGGFGRRDGGGTGRASALAGLAGARVTLAAISRGGYRDGPLGACQK